MRMPRRISVEEIEKFLAYDPLSGVFTWKVNRPYGVKAGDIAGSLDKNGYRLISLLNVQYYAHRLAWVVVYRVWPKGVVDHIFGGNDYNSIANLRDATQRVNCQNTYRHRQGKLLGTTKNKVNLKKPWVSQANINGKKIFLGRYETEELAHQVYVECLSAHGIPLDQPNRSHHDPQ
jgi:hypothetical protein